MMKAYAASKIGEAGHHNEHRCQAFQFGSGMILVSLHVLCDLRTRGFRSFKT